MFILGVISVFIHSFDALGDRQQSKYFIPALSDLDCHGAGHYVSGGQIFSVGCVALHETLSLAVDQDPSLATAALCD